MVCFLVRRFPPRICTTTHASEKSNARLPQSFLVIVVSMFQVVVQQCPHFRLQCPDRFVDVESVQDAVWSTAPTPTLLLLRRARDQFWFQKIDAH